MLETAWESRWVPDYLWGCSSVGRAPALQAGGQRFDPAYLHHSTERLKMDSLDRATRFKTGRAR